MAKNGWRYALTENLPPISVNDIDQIWATILLEAFWDMVDKHGFDLGSKTFMQLVVDDLKFTPCNPNFLTARKAILKAENQNNYNGNRCLLWTAFARRGLSNRAKPGVNSKLVPPDCPPIDYTLFWEVAPTK